MSLVCDSCGRKLTGRKRSEVYIQLTRKGGLDLCDRCESALFDVDDDDQEPVTDGGVDEGDDVESTSVVKTSANGVGLWFEGVREGERVRVIQHVNPVVDANDMEEDPALPVYSGPASDARLFGKAVYRAAVGDDDSDVATDGGVDEDDPLDEAREHLNEILPGADGVFAVTVRERSDGLQSASAIKYRSDLEEELAVAVMKELRSLTGRDDEDIVADGGIDVGPRDDVDPEPDEDVVDELRRRVDDLEDRVDALAETSRARGPAGPDRGGRR